MLSELLPARRPISAIMVLGVYQPAWRPTAKFNGYFNKYSCNSIVGCNRVSCEYFNVSSRDVTVGQGFGSAAGSYHPHICQLRGSYRQKLSTSHNYEITKSTGDILSISASPMHMRVASCCRGLYISPEWTSSCAVYTLSTNVYICQNLTPQTLKIQTVSPKPKTLKSLSPNPKPETLNPKPPNTKPETLDPKP